MLNVEFETYWKKMFSFAGVNIDYLNTAKIVLLKTKKHIYKRKTAIELAKAKIPPLFQQGRVFL